MDMLTSRGKGTDLNNNEALQGRAKRKLITQSMVLNPRWRGFTIRAYKEKITLRIKKSPDKKLSGLFKVAG